MINIILNGLLKDRKNHMIQLTRSCLRGRNSPTEFVDGIDNWSDERIVKNNDNTVTYLSGFIKNGDEPLVTMGK